MSWIGNLLGGGIKEVVGAVGGVIDNLHTSQEEKAQANVELQKILAAQQAKIEESLMVELQAKERVLVAELIQGDNYTKRARPTVVYFGLFTIFFNYCLIPAIQYFGGQVPQSFDLPVEFWAAWGGIVATWTIGRTVEKKNGGTESKTVSILTGTKLIK